MLVTCFCKKDLHLMDFTDFASRDQISSDILSSGPRLKQVLEMWKKYFLTTKG